MSADRIPHILIIDDELHICMNCLKILSKPEYSVDYSLNGYDAIKKMEEKHFDVVITDLKMSSLGGMEVLRRIKETCVDTVVIVITGYASVSSAVEVMKMGAFDYLPKPFTPDELRAIVIQALIESEIRRQNRQLKVQKKDLKPYEHQLIGESHGIKKVVDMIKKVAPTDSTVLILGESGTGKELVARAIHANSRRKNQVFFAVDCGTLSADRLESELFGHVKGAFTGAHKDKAGIFKSADQGTVFLDEISNIPFEVQAKLLRFLETQELLPLGSTSLQKIDIRLILATNRDLTEMVSEGTFREDIYYRIFVYPINIPPLRERKTDIMPIAYNFLKQFSDGLKKNTSGFDNDAVRRLIEHDWPGNVRELRNVIERATILGQKELIGPNELPSLNDIEQLAEQIPSTNEELKRIKKEIRQKAVRKVEKNFILNALVQNNWNVTHAAKNVGLQRTNFQNLMKNHGIKLPR